MTVEPPYLHIAAELRRRIAARELRPGDRLPSIRALAAGWGVAPGTAAKALNELRQAGLVRAQPRVGSIVAPPAARAGSRTAPRARPASTGTAAMPEVELSRDRVVRAAMAIADAQGLEAVSMRAVAARLGVATMSLYRHVAGKDELVLLMADVAYGEGEYPAVPPDGWRARLEFGARLLWGLHCRHPWLAHLGPLARPLPLPNLLRHGEWIIGALADLGLSADRVLDLQILLFSHGQGLAVHLEREARARAETGLSDEQWGDAQAADMHALAYSGRYPNLARMMDGLVGGYDFDLDALFALGLQALLDGFERLVGARQDGGEAA
ncbi:GntR family transcriptional regulator [Micromonospora sp. WMMD1128]|uniref:GntR family transcriptional regulator n=1 Tax=Micromonospora sp. WMMD1128 TaxID=3015150 RepID=UPI00248BC0B5|nr:GntR family transcriptional regulator [Micromonospora sp. WMMD1128]WBB76500.1 GntR family transcriptional regulator [Micromonospora sp. WMMD1128]